MQFNRLLTTFLNKGVMQHLKQVVLEFPKGIYLGKIPDMHQDYHAFFIWLQNLNHSDQLVFALDQGL